MVREIILEKKVANWQKETGRFVDISDIHTVVSGEPVDIYRPEALNCELLGWDKRDYLLLSYRPGAIDCEKHSAAIDAIRSGATFHGNSVRGTAGGLKRTGETLEKCVYDGEWRLLQEIRKRSFARTKYSVLSGREESTIETIAAEYIPWETSHNARPWRDHRNRPSKQQFLAEMHELAQHLDHKQREQAVDDYIAKRLYRVANMANNVENGVGGTVARTAAYPYCRMSSWSSDELQHHAAITGLAVDVDRLFMETTPDAYNRQRKFVSGFEKGWSLADTVYTTLTFNRNFRTAAHTDSGDYPDGFGNLVAFRRGSYSGGVTVFPEWGVGVDMQHGDFMAMDVHQIHGNTAFYDCSPDYERLSLVCYCRADMADCGTPQYEELRKRFLQTTKTPDRKTGIWPAMWESQQWKDFLQENSNAV